MAFICLNYLIDPKILRALTAFIFYGFSYFCLKLNIMNKNVKDFHPEA